jgi:lipooligosaccharide transport system permease protein
MVIYRQNLVANMAPTLIDPVLFIAAFGIGLGAYVSKIGEHEYINYMAPGLAVTTALFTAFFETSYGFFIRLRFENIYKAMLTTPVGPNELICGEFIWVGLKGALMSLGVSIVVACFGLVEWQFIFLMPIVGFLVALACGALGFMAAALVKNINQFQTVYALVISPMFFFSGVFYPVDSLPTVIKVTSNLSPLYHGVRLGQQILWGKDIGAAFLFHAPILILMIAVLAFIAHRMIKPKIYL